jgi:fructose-1,6-bisphosphatase/sedoheptulose 1,7-bisphosphatase-like protein
MLPKLSMALPSAIQPLDGAGGAAEATLAASTVAIINPDFQVALFIRLLLQRRRKT